MRDAFCNTMCELRNNLTKDYTLSFTSLSHLAVEEHLFKSSQLQGRYLQEDIFHYQINKCSSKKASILHFHTKLDFFLFVIIAKNVLFECVEWPLHPVLFERDIENPPVEQLLLAVTVTVWNPNLL